MVQQTSEMVHKEKRKLWTVKHLLTRFRGDSSCIPADWLLSTDHATLFPIETIQDRFTSYSIPTQLNNHEGAKENAPGNGNNRATVITHNFGIPGGKSFHSEEHILTSNPTPGASQRHQIAQPVTKCRIATNQKRPSSAQNGSELVAHVEGEPAAESRMRPINDSTHNRHSSHQLKVTDSVQELSEVDDSHENSIERATRASHSARATSKHSKEESEPPGSAPLVDEVEAKEFIQVPSRRMRTRAQAQAVSDKTHSSHTRSSSPETSEAGCIHSFYLMPHSAVLDRDYGLPSLEADETRRILMMWVQKQEEVVRGVERLYEYLLKADRMRKNVIRWCKAESHIGEMSDGEDWYDKEEWGLEEDLKKGQLEEEDESTNQGKKTRVRRVAQ
ncbi:hypothetical protein MMC26_006462 [Xylographa opegraphella]|nr:hypothetical protein [Xylographa opegraphella]